LSEVRCGDNVVTELSSSPVSDAVLNVCFPPADPAACYAHYTSFPSFRSILASGTLRLYSLIKRIDEDEYAPFCVDHGYAGLLEVDPGTGFPRFEDHCRNLFFSSFSNPGAANADYLWHHFGDKGRGVRLILKISPVQQRVDFRTVTYSNGQSRTLINKLNAAVEADCGLKLVLRGIVRLAAFYLPLGYCTESETRLLVKRHDYPVAPGNPLADIAESNGLEYVPIRLNKDNDLCRIDLVRVECGPHCPLDSVRAELRRHAMFASLIP